jgi:folate/biopterin transporter
LTLNTRFKKLKRYDDKYLNNLDIHLNLYQEKKIPLYWSKNIPTTPEIWRIALLYFTHGFSGISKIAMSFYYKDILNLSPLEISIITSITAIPLIIKPIYGFISDSYPFFGYNRKSYLIFSSLLGSISWIIMANFVSLTNINIIYSVFLITLSFISLSFTDVLIDAIAVSKIRENQNINSIQTIFWISSSLGSIISSYLSGYLLQNYNIAFVFYLSAVIPLITATITIFIKEPLIFKLENSHYNTIQLLKIKIKKILKILLQKKILYPLIFLMLMNAMPKIGTTMFFFEVNKLGFQPEFFGKLALFSSVSSLFGILLYNLKFKSIQLRTILKWACIFGVILGIFTLILVTRVNKLIGIPDTLFVILDDIVLSIFYKITLLPILVIATKVCPPGIEGMLFATIISANNLSNIIGKLLGGLLTKQMGITNDNFTNIPFFIILTNLFGLIPLLFLKFIPK